MKTNFFLFLSKFFCQYLAILHLLITLIVHADIYKLYKHKIIQGLHLFVFVQRFFLTK